MKKCWSIILDVLGIIVSIACFIINLVKGNTFSYVVWGLVFVMWAVILVFDKIEYSRKTNTPEEKKDEL